MKRIAIVGASGHGKVVADIARKNEYEDIVFFDDDETIVECGGYSVVGKTAEAAQTGRDIIVAIGNGQIRKRLQKDYELQGCSVPILVHPNAVVAENVSIGAGTVVMAGAVINSGTKIGKGCIINTCASVDHDCQVGDFSHISVDAHLAGTVEIGCNTWIGIGAVISNNLSVAAKSVIGAGAVVVADIKETGTYMGVPAKKKKDVL